MSLPKSLKRLAANPIVDEVWSEGEDGYWVTFVPGWHWEGVHCVHEWTVRDTLRAFSEVTACDCDDCLKAIERNRLDTAR